MYVLDMVGTIMLFIKEMYGNKKKNPWSGAFSVVGRRILTNYLFLFGQITQYNCYVYTYTYLIAINTHTFTLLIELKCSLT